MPKSCQEPNIEESTAAPKPRESPDIKDFTPSM
jgi:hypothetical protein